MNLLKSVQLNGFLSFSPKSEAIKLTSLNIIIGPNGSGKSNLLEAIELLHATPTAFADAIRDGGGTREWIWKGKAGDGKATIDAIVESEKLKDLRYRLQFTVSGQRTEITDEVIEESEKRKSQANDVFFFYRYSNGNPVINIGSGLDKQSPRHLQRQHITPDESVLSQKKDADFYPELAWLGKQFGQIQMFREWSFGRYTKLREPQRPDLSGKELFRDSSNLGLVLNQLEHTDAWFEFCHLLKRFFPRFERFSTLVSDNTTQFYLHEKGLKAPIPATRLSDGTIRFMAMLALLLSPNLPPLICIEEPELGLHPDALSIFAELLVAASSRTQVIVTTHSDALVSALSEQADSVLVCEYLEGTVLRRIESEKLKYWLDKYRLGEIWRIGELGGNL